MIVVISRRSPAAGWCRASRSIAAFSTFTSSSSILRVARRSPAGRASASALKTASTACSTDCCTIALIRATRRLQVVEEVVEVSGHGATSRYCGARFAILGSRSGDPTRIGTAYPNRPVRSLRSACSSGLVKIVAVWSYSISEPEVEERRVVADAGGLLHVVGDDDDRVAALQLVDQVLDLAGGDRVQRAGTARPSAGPCGLVASARAMHSRCCCPPDRPRALCCSRSFTSSHSAALRQAVLDELVQVGRGRGCPGAAGRRRCCRRCSWGTGWASGRPAPPAGAARRGRRRGS